MKIYSMKCDHCEFKGYSIDLCRSHHRKMVAGKYLEQCPGYSPVKKICKTAAWGAGVGVAAAVVGIAAVPATAIKAVFGHVVAVKVGAGAGGGITGAGVNVMRKKKNEKIRAGGKGKKRLHLPTLGGLTLRKSEKGSSNKTGLLQSGGLE